MPASIFDGMTVAQKQAALASAQQALIQLQLGQQGVSFSYTQGDGGKTITRQMTNPAQLTQLIAQLQCELGLRFRARAPIRLLYR